MEKKQLPDAIPTERLLLKKHTLELAEQMFAYVNQDRERLRCFLPWVDGTLSTEDEKFYITDALKQWDECLFFDFGMFHKPEQLYMGNIGVHFFSWEHHHAEIGYWILGQFEGQGYVSEAVLALEQVLFAMGFHRLEIRCSSSNRRSSAVPERLGYHLDGVLRENILEQGQYSDTRIYSKLNPSH